MEEEVCTSSQLNRSLGKFAGASWPKRLSYPHLIWDSPPRTSTSSWTKNGLSKNTRWTRTDSPGDSHKESGAVGSFLMMREKEPTWRYGRGYSWDHRKGSPDRWRWRLQYFDDRKSTSKKDTWQGMLRKLGTGIRVQGTRSHSQGHSFIHEHVPIWKALTSLSSSQLFFWDTM